MKATGNRTIKLGFKALGSEARESGLPDAKKGDRAQVTSVNLHAGETSPPKHFTEATLLQAMENTAKKKGAKYAEVDTFSFQALPFYQKQGFEVFGTLENYPISDKKYYLNKVL